MSPHIPFMPTPKEQTPTEFTPTMEPLLEHATFVDIGILIALLRLSKTPEGLRVIRELGREFLRGIFDTLHALGQASAANKVASWANPYIVSLVLRRFGFIEARHQAGFAVGLSVISGAEVAEGFLDVLQGMFPFSKPEPSEYPQSIVFDSRSAAASANLEELEKLRSLLNK